MVDDIERRMADGAEALREHELTQRSEAELRARMVETTARISKLRARHADEQRDVDRLEGPSLTRVLVALRGSRTETLERERAEAAAAGYRLAEAEGQLDALRREFDAVRRRRVELSGAPRAYAALLDERERHLSESDDPRRPRLLEIATEGGRLAGELREIGQASAAAENAKAALAEVREKLGGASQWSTYDTFLGGGMFSSAMKHGALDDAAEAAARADRCLAVLRTELADVPGVPPTAPQLAVGGFTRFADVWFDNIFTDLAVRDQIKQAQQNVERSIGMVGELCGRLERRAADLRGRLAAIETERRDLLTRGWRRDITSSVNGDARDGSAER